MNKTIIIAAVLIVVAGAGGFLGGMQYQKSQTTSRFAQFAGGGNGQFRRFGQAGGGAGANTSAIRGQVVSTDSNSITVKLPDGSSKILVVGSNTTFMKSTSASLSDLKSGDTIMAFGTTNSDGSVTARNVDINPPTRGLPNARPTQ